jgi:hypothetical protein
MAGIEGARCDIVGTLTSSQASKLFLKIENIPEIHYQFRSRKKKSFSLLR